VARSRGRECLAGGLLLIFDLSEGFAQWYHSREFRKQVRAQEQSR
jgi:hypothetical protein